VDEALARIDSGSYGLCDLCHDPVEPERLLADPLARVCLDCLSPDERRRLEHDLELARSIQAALLPPRAQVLAGWEIRYEYVPAGPVSGDYCDVIPSPGGGPLVLFGDVSGKGVAASLLMSGLHAIFRSLAPDDAPLAELAARANRIFCESTTAASYATLVCGRAHDDGRVELLTAGHWPPLVLRGGSVEPLAIEGPAFGLSPTATFAPATIALDREDLVLLYTDGLTEARNRSGEEYGDNRLRAVLAASAAAPPSETIARVVGSLFAFLDGAARHDDLTVMALGRIGT
jgi:sigma-B regulation protein RsbU (phosphoserine phosphatase)